MIFSGCAASTSRRVAYSMTFSILTGDGPVVWRAMVHAFATRSAKAPGSLCDIQSLLVMV